MWAKIIIINRTKDFNYFSLCAFNLFNTWVSQLSWITEINELFHDKVRPLSKAPNPQLLPGHRIVSCPSAPSVCASKWWEHISLLVILSIIVYVTIKAHLSLIIIIIIIIFSHYMQDEMKMKSKIVLVSLRKLV